jgi:hypothetical protein
LRITSEFNEVEFPTRLGNPEARDGNSIWESEKISWKFLKRTVKFLLVSPTIRRVVGLRPQSFIFYLVTTTMARTAKSLSRDFSFLKNRFAAIIVVVFICKFTKLENTSTPDKK